MGHIKNIAIEIQELHQKLEGLQAENLRLRAWFTSALLAGGGVLKKQNIKGSRWGVLDYVGYTFNNGLSIENIYGSGFELNFGGEVVRSFEELLEKIPPPEREVPGAIFIDKQGIHSP